MIVLLLVMLLVGLMVTSPLPISDWQWDTVPGGSSAILLLVVVVALFIYRP